jgi:hypothetical protein
MSTGGDQEKQALEEKQLDVVVGWVRTRRLTSVAAAALT